MKSPRYRWAKPGEFPTEERQESVSKPRKKLARRKRTKDTELFDIRTWRLPMKWRRHRRVGDDVMARMTAGCSPARFEELVRREPTRP